MLDSSLSNTGSQFIFWRRIKSMRERGIDLNKDVCICFVLSEAFVVGF